jgi:hypothetical protein
VGITGALSASSATFSGAATLNNTLSVSGAATMSSATFSSSARLNDGIALNIRSGSDTNHGLRYANTAPTFSTGCDGPALYGYGGGILGTTNGSATIILSWNYFSSTSYGITFNGFQMYAVTTYNFASSGATITMTGNESFIYITGNTGNLQLPDASQSNMSGRYYQLKNVSGNITTIKGYSTQKIDSSSTYNFGSNPNVIRLLCVANNWALM